MAGIALTWSKRLWFWMWWLGWWPWWPCPVAPQRVEWLSTQATCDLGSVIRISGLVPTAFSAPPWRPPNLGVLLGSDSGNVPSTPSWLPITSKYFQVGCVFDISEDQDTLVFRQSVQSSKWARYSGLHFHLFSPDEHPLMQSLGVGHGSCPKSQVTIVIPWTGSQRWPSCSCWMFQCWWTSSVTCIEAEKYNFWLSQERSGWILRDIKYNFDIFDQVCKYCQVYARFDEPSVVGTLCMHLHTWYAESQWSELSLNQEKLSWMNLRSFCRPSWLVNLGWLSVESVELVKLVGSPCFRWWHPRQSSSKCFSMSLDIFGYSYHWKRTTEFLVNCAWSGPCVGHWNLSNLASLWKDRAVAKWIWTRLT